MPSIVRITARALLPALALLAAGCNGNNLAPESPSQPPPDRPPTPSSITVKNPGGDAPDPIKAALQRLLTEPVQLKRKDRWGTLRVPLADWKNWRRIRIWGHPTRATFQYGEERIGLLTIRYSKIEGPNDPERCLADFVRFAGPIATSYGVRLGESRFLETTQKVRGKESPILVRLQEGGVDSILTSDDYIGFIAAYQSWPGTCLVQGFAALATDHPELATQVRDRWVKDAVSKLVWDRKVKEAPDPSLMR